MVPRDLTAVTTSNWSDYTTAISTVLSSGTYLSPLNPCDFEEAGDACSYNLEFTGPGFDCQDVTSSSNSTDFASAGLSPEEASDSSLVIAASYLSRRSTDDSINVFNGSVFPHTSDQTMQMSFQTWDTKHSLYQAVRCVVVSRSYNVEISHKHLLHNQSPFLPVYRADCFPARIGSKPSCRERQR